MSTTTELELDAALEPAPLPTTARIDSLKKKAGRLNIKFHPKIGEEALASKIQQFEANMDQAAFTDAQKAVSQEDVNLSAVAENVVLSSRQRKMAIRREQSALVRITLNCMNADKKEWEGEFFKVSNSVLDLPQRYVKYGEMWHVPKLMLSMIEERQCKQWYKAKNSRGEKVNKVRMIKEFQITVHPQITPAELEALKAKQLQTRAVDETPEGD